jgi:hypothetical protein
MINVVYICLCTLNVDVPFVILYQVVYDVIVEYNRI